MHDHNNNNKEEANRDQLGLCWGPVWAHGFEGVGLQTVNKRQCTRLREPPHTARVLFFPVEKGKQHNDRWLINKCEGKRESHVIVWDALAAVHRSPYDITLTITLLRRSRVKGMEGTNEALFVSR